MFLVSTRYQKEHWVRGILLFSVGWLLLNWLQYVRADLFSLNVFLGYQAPGILNFPLFGWILQFARAAFFGAVPLTYTAIILVALTTLAANLLVYALARDYYEDILEPAERLNLLRKAKHSGKMQAKTGLWLRFLNRKRVIVERRYPGSRAFMFNQVVQYRRTSINEYVGYLAPLAVLTGLITGFIALYNGQSWNYGLLYAQNGILAYFLLISNSSGPLSKELALPYMYTLPGTFFQKAIAVNTLPTLRFGLNVFLLNLSYATIVYLPIQDAGIFLSAVLLSVLLTSFYWEQAHIIVLAHVLLPSSIDRKFFYPLIMFVELLLIGIPALIAGGLAVWLIQSTWFAIIAVIAVNMAMGIVLLFFSDKIFPLLEIREFVE
ncbi:MAG: putative ABC exporter domain-containing protein [Heliobacteriaceae bacterium]|nr:putative ABC exporter domain-containing protein [Heliobacteriaceae bacterium]